jgi:hypothetical protein
MASMVKRCPAVQPRHCYVSVRVVRLPVGAVALVAYAERAVSTAGSTGSLASGSSRE